MDPARTVRPHLRRGPREVPRGRQRHAPGVASRAAARAGARAAGDGRRPHRRRRRRRAADRLQRLPRRRGLLRLGRAGGAAARRRVPRQGAPRGRGAAVHPRAQSLGLLVRAARHARGRRPQPQLHRLPPPAAGQPGLRPAGRLPAARRNGRRTPATSASSWPTGRRTACRRCRRRSPAASTAIPTACSTAAPPHLEPADAAPGAAPARARAAASSAGSTCTAAWAERRRRAHLRGRDDDSRSTAPRPGGATASRSPRTARRVRPRARNLWHAVYDECPRPTMPASRSSSAPSRTTRHAALSLTIGSRAARPARRAAARRPRRDAPRVLHRHARVEAGRGHAVARGGGAGDRRDGVLAMMS